MNITDFTNAVNSISDKELEKYNSFSEEPANISNLKSHMINSNGITALGLEADKIVVDTLIAKNIRGCYICETSSMVDSTEPYDFNLQIFDTNTFSCPFDCYCVAYDYDDYPIAADLIIDNTFRIENESYIIIPKGCNVKIDSDEMPQYFLICPTYKEVSYWSQVYYPELLHYQTDDILPTGDNVIITLLGIVDMASNNAICSVTIAGNETDVACSFLLNITTINYEIISKTHTFKWKDENENEIEMTIELGGDIWNPFIDIY